jgi:hypothetical protein
MREGSISWKLNDIPKRKAESTCCERVVFGSNQ